MVGIFCGLKTGSDCVLSGGRLDDSVDERSSKPLDRMASCDLLPPGKPFIISDDGFLHTSRPNRVQRALNEQCPQLQLQRSQIFVRPKANIGL